MKDTDTGGFPGPTLYVVEVKLPLVRQKVDFPLLTRFPGSRVSLERNGGSSKSFRELTDVWGFTSATYTSDDQDGLVGVGPTGGVWV